MSKKAILVHGWAGNPNNCWFPWLKKELESRGYEVIIPEMPETEMPMIDPWVNKLAEVAGQVDEETILIGHSIGCQTIFRYLMTLPDDVQIGQVVCVAGWFSLMGLETETEQEIAKPWIEEPLDWQKIKNAASNITVILSGNDPFVPLAETKKIFEEKLNAKALVESGQGHFDDDSENKELPVILVIIDNQNI